MRTKEWSFFKRTGSYADSLATIGLGKLIYLLTGRSPRIIDKGSRYIVSIEEEIDLEEIDYSTLRKDPGYTYVRLKEDDEKAPLTSRSYEEGRKKLLEYREIRSKLKSLRNLTDEERRLLEDKKPDSDWYLIQCLRVIQAFGPYNGLHYEIRNANIKDFAKSVRLKLEGLAIGKLLTEVSSPFKPKVSAVQAFNPSVGKGINRPKPDGATLASLPSNYNDWFEEWLKFLGVDTALHSYVIGDDFKFLCLVPNDLDFAVLYQRIMPNFRDIPNQPRHSVQIDILAALRLADYLLRYNVDGVMGRRPNDLLQAIHTAYFKSLGTSRSLTNQSFIGLPGWFPVKDNEDIIDWINILKDHERIIRSLNEEHSEELALLQQYRDFISANKPKSLFQFLAGNAIHYLRMKERKKYAVLPTQQEIRRLVMKGYPAFYSLLQNSGFKEVAKAMRNATITEQYYKSKGQQVFDIHYALFQKIKQHARFSDKLLSTLLEFINDYNRENARRKEQLARNNQKGRSRSSITTQAVEDFVKAFEQYDNQSEIFAMLLIAYASSSDLKQNEESNNDVETNDFVTEFVIEDEE